MSRRDSRRGLPPGPPDDRELMGLGQRYILVVGLDLANRETLDQLTAAAADRLGPPPPALLVTPSDVLSLGLNRTGRELQWHERPTLARLIETEGAGRAVGLPEAVAVRGRELLALYDERDKRRTAIAEGLGLEAAEEHLEATSDVVWELVMDIMTTPAFTIAGLAVKAATRFCYVPARHPAEDSDLNDDLAQRLALSVLHTARTTGAPAWIGSDAYTTRALAKLGREPGGGASG